MTEDDLKGCWTPAPSQKGAVLQLQIVPESRGLACSSACPDCPVLSCPDHSAPLSSATSSPPPFSSSQNARRRQHNTERAHERASERSSKHERHHQTTDLGGAHNCEVHRNVFVLLACFGLGGLKFRQLSEPL
jgi:hypothetical protein